MRISGSPGVAWLWVISLPLAGMGCSGSGLNQIHGKVIYKKEPLKGVLVVFHSKSASIKAHPPTARTKDDGSFTVSTGGKEGAPAGDYVVTFTCSKEVAPPKSKKLSLDFGSAPEMKDYLDGVYADASSSSFKVTIKPGVNQLEPFHLK